MPANLLLAITCQSALLLAAAAKSLQSCLTLCDPIDGSPPGSPVPGILQARTLEWVAMSFSNARQWKVKVKLLSRVRLLATPSTAAYQAPPFMGFSRQEYWSGVPLPSLPYCLEKTISEKLLSQKFISGKSYLKFLIRQILFQLVKKINSLGENVSYMAYVI